MEILQIAGLGLVATIFVVILKQEKPELAMLLSIVTGVIIFILVLGKIASVFNILEELANRANVNRFYLSTLLKIVGIAYIAEFGAQVCRDAGEGAIASKVEFAAKIIMMVMAVPIIAAILETIIRLLP
ncbi:stage III sporulation protein AD [Calderihabitans maritimus]|uniref:Stage iii sporulation protein ad n=1 Tax=Calderihabitans maritimus TaxID=1246530 RepID=A0A1Z5HXZ2_9FIRM|nr:stage III sporulation protein AD [Calderihabitans maritimus]GAW94160.1 stage iii sporulation protein ad [Calderihabitans maritimus]